MKVVLQFLFDTSLHSSKALGTFCPFYVRFDYNSMTKEIKTNSAPFDDQAFAVLFEDLVLRLPQGGALGEGHALVAGVGARSDERGLAGRALSAAAAGTRLPEQVARRELDALVRNEGAGSDEVLRRQRGTHRPHAGGGGAAILLGGGRSVSRRPEADARLLRG